MAEVKVGDSSLTIPRFSAFKVVRAGRLVAEIAKKYPQVILDMAKFTREYEDQNSIVITRAMAKTPRFQDYGFGTRDFDDDGIVRLPQSPSMQEQIFAVLPQIMDAAEHEVLQLCALVLAPNSELEAADADDSVDEYLKTEAKKLLHKADGDQLIDIAVVAATVAREQFAHKLGDAGNALALFTDPNGNSAQTTPKSPESSIDSPAPMDGVTSASPTEPLGVS